MRGLIITVVLLMLPALAQADYDPDKIKAEIDQADKVFQVESWRLSENGEAWVAKTKLKDVVISVGKKNAGMISVLTSSDGAVRVLIRCLALGGIGLNPTTEPEREKIGQTVTNGTQSEGVSRMTLNGVIFEVKPIEMAGAVVFSCMLKPEA